MGYSGGKGRLMEGYCLKCKKKVRCIDSEIILMGNGKPAMKGACPNCKTRVYKIGLANLPAYYREEDALALKVLGEEYFA
jgi:hypothetical protein